jgi:hypothetical protein
VDCHPWHRPGPNHPSNPLGCICRQRHASLHICSMPRLASHRAVSSQATHRHNRRRYRRAFCRRSASAPSRHSHARTPRPAPARCSVARFRDRRSSRSGVARSSASRAATCPSARSIGGGRPPPVRTACGSQCSPPPGHQYLVHGPLAVESQHVVPSKVEWLMDGLPPRLL